MSKNLAEDLARDNFMQLWMAYCAEKEKRQDAEARLADLEALLRYIGREAVRDDRKDGAYWVRLYYGDFERIEALLADSAPATAPR